MYICIASTQKLQMLTTVRYMDEVTATKFSTTVINPAWIHPG